MTRAGDQAVVTLPGEVDISSSDQLRATLLAALDQGARLLIVDMSKTTFCDSAGLSALIVAHRQAGAVSAQLRLAGVCAAVLRVMRITGMDRLVSLYPTLAAARAPEARAPEAAPERAP